jgi:protein-tyrosine phosphatase
LIPRLKQWLSGEPAAEAAAPGLRILMVCTGNICRSPTAEGVLRHKLTQAGMAGAVQVGSAGTQGYHTAEPPDPRAVRAAAARGYDLARLRARPLRPDDFQRFDVLLAMDKGHLEWLHKRRPPAAGAIQLGLLMTLALRRRDVVEVPDPYYGGPAGFEHVLDLVEDACDGIVERLARQLPLVDAAPTLR